MVDSQARHRFHAREWHPKYLRVACTIFAKTSWMLNILSHTTQSSRIDRAPIQSVQLSTHTHTQSAKANVILVSRRWRKINFQKSSFAIRYSVCQEPRAKRIHIVSAASGVCCVFLISLSNLSFNVSLVIVCDVCVVFRDRGLLRHTLKWANETKWCPTRPAAVLARRAVFDFASPSDACVLLLHIRCGIVTRSLTLSLSFPMHQRINVYRGPPPLTRR